MDKRFVIVAGVLMYLITAYFSYDFFSNFAGTSSKPTTTGFENNIDVDKADVDIDFQGPLTEECPLNGEKLTKEHKARWEKRRPLGVMIENHLEARDQSGLSRADNVYEFVAEGGITRFLAVFYCKDARLIGPVRSARMYFIKTLQGYGKYPLYAHVGGANTDGPADALGEINDLDWAGYNDMNQFSIPFPTFYRDYERLPGVATEHTMYSSTSKLWQYAAEKRKLTNKDTDGDKWDEDFESWKFQDGKASQGDTASISYDFWTGKKEYSVKWTYDATTNSYLRAHGNGKPHNDKNTNKQLAAKNVVVMFVKESTANDGYEGGHMLYGVVGKGNALVFQNGDVVKATWKKAKEEDLVRFYDASGDEIEFVRGQIWVSGIPIGNTVDY